jgi:hypothetical protein
MGSASAEESTAAQYTAPLAPAATIVVTSTADSGPGTLRWALEIAVASDTITFDTTVFPPASPVTIALSSALPKLDDGNVRVAWNLVITFELNGVRAGSQQHLQKL